MRGLVLGQLRQVEEECLGCAEDDRQGQRRGSQRARWRIVGLAILAHGLDAARAGMKIAERGVARLPRIICFLFHLPERPVNGARPAKFAVCFGASVSS